MADDQIRQELLGTGWDEVSINQSLFQKNTLIKSGSIFEKNNIVAITIGLVLALIPTISAAISYSNLNPITLIYKYIFKQPLGLIYGLIAAEIAYDLVIGLLVALINKAKTYSVIWITGLLGFVIFRAIILIMAYGMEDLLNSLLYPTIVFFVSATIGYFIVKGFFRLRGA